MTKNTEVGLISINIDETFSIRLEKLHRTFRNLFSIETGRDWIALHEQAHIELGHFSILEGVPTFNLISKSGKSQVQEPDLPRVRNHRGTIYGGCLRICASHSCTVLVKSIAIVRRASIITTANRFFSHVSHRSEPQWNRGNAYDGVA